MDSRQEPVKNGKSIQETEHFMDQKLMFISLMQSEDLSNVQQFNLISNCQFVSDLRYVFICYFNLFYFILFDLLLFYYSFLFYFQFSLLPKLKERLIVQSSFTELFLDQLKDSLQF